jgi:hypothetical protein
MAARHRGIAFRVLGLATCLPLSACLDGADAPAGQDALRTITFYDGAVTIDSPRGYCIDRTSVRHDADGRFALLASCESLTGEPGVAVAPAVMTVAVLPRTDETAPPDAAAMAQAVGPGTVQRAEEDDGITLVRVAQGGEAVLPEGDPAHWRASLMLNGHVVGLAAYGPKGGEIAGSQGRELLRALGATLRAAEDGR